MALAAAARSRRLSGHLFRRLQPTLPHLFSPHYPVDDHELSTPSPLRPIPCFRSPHFQLHQSSGAGHTQTLFPFCIHLTGAGKSRRSFSSLPSYRVGDAGAGAVLTDAADAAVVPAAQASFPSEVAWVAEDSSLSVAAVQHLIDAVHSYTGLNWWLSIAMSTVLLRAALFPLSIYNIKRFPLLKKEYSEAKKLMESDLPQASDEKSLQEYKQRALSAYQRMGISICIAILPPHTFMALYFAISNMVDKLPCLKEGGALWFTDLTAPDALYIFPTTTTLLLLLRYEFALHYSKTERGNKSAFVKTLFVLTFPLAASLPQAICTYIVTWSFVSLAYLIVLNQPVVKKLLHGDGTKPACPSSGTQKGPTAVEEHKESLPPDQREASESSVDRAMDQSDKKSEKDS